MRTGDRESGQASVELVALLPLLAAVVLGGWQVVVAVQAWGMAGAAARAASRAVAVGADPERAARAALPGQWGRRVHVPPVAAGQVTVRLEVPLVVTGARLADVRVTAGPASGAGAR